MNIIRGDALELLHADTRKYDLIVTDPPYAFGGSGTEHALSATVAIVLRESAKRLQNGRWMVVFCASSWRSTSYMVESLRGIVEPIRIATWCKPASRSKVSTPGWAWASVSVLAFRKGRADKRNGSPALDHITAAPLTTGRRAQLPPEVCRWAVQPFAVPRGYFLDPFAGSGALPNAANHFKMKAIGFEKNP